MKKSIMSIGYKFIVFGCASILCASYPLATADIIAKTCQPDPEKCLDGLDECKSSQICYYGTCTSFGTCDCFNCFHGEKCDMYNDNASPKFEEPTDSVTVYGIEEGVIYQAKATDSDSASECSTEYITSDNCICGATSYSIISEQNQNFIIESDTGNVFIKNHDNLENDRLYHITILAQGFLGNGTLSSYQDVMELTVSVVAAKEEENSVRVKRDAAGTTEDSTVITLTKVTDKDSTETKLGDKIDYRMEIWVPKLTTPMDLKVEIFTSDPETKQAAFALMKPNVYIESSVSTTVTPTPVMGPNHYLSTIYDRSTIDFGLVNSAESVGPVSNGSRIVIDFSVITISSNTTHTSPYRVSAGAEYKDQTFVWVGQSQVSLIVEEVFFDTMATLTGPDSIAQDSFGTYTVKSTLNGPSPDVTFAAFLTVGDEDVISIGSIGVESMGPGYSATVDFAADRSLAPPVYAYSVTKNSIISSSINVDFIAHEVQDDSTDATITWIFSVWAIGGIPLPTGDVKVGIAMQQGAVKIWTSVKTLSITNGSPPSGAKVTFISTELSGADGNIPPGGTAIIITKLSLKANDIQDVTITIVTEPEFSHCETRLSKRGFNIPYIPHANLTTETDKTTHTTTIKLGYIGNTGQVTSDNDIDDEFWFEVGIQANKDAADNTYATAVTITIDGESKTTSLTIDTGVQNTVDDVTVTIGPSEGSTAMLNGWLTGAAAAIDISATFPAKHAVSDVTVEGTGMLSNFDFDIRVCRIDVSFMGRNVPCIKRGAQEFKKTADTRKYDDYVISPMETICSSARTGDGNSTWDNKIVYTVAYELPLDVTPKTDPYSLTAGLKLEPDKIWAGYVPFTPSTTKVDAYAESIQPLWNVRNGLQTVNTNKVNIAKFYFKMPPGAHAVLTMTIEVDPSKLVICPLQIRFGSGYPCEDDKPFKKWGQSDPTTLNYEHDTSTEEKGAKKAILDFKNIHNIGTAPLVSSAVFDSNTVEVILPVYVLATGAATITVSGNGISPAFTKTQTFTSDGTPAASSAASDVTLTLAENDANSEGSYTGYKKGIAKTALLTVAVGDGFYAKPLVVEISTGNKFNICCAAAYYVGRNLPCVNASKIPYEQVPEANPDNDGNAIMSTLRITFETTCQYPISTESDANELRILIGFKVAESIGAITLSAKAIVDGSETTATPLSIDETTDPDIPVVAEPDKDGGVELMDDTDGNGQFGEPIESKIGEFVWLKFGLLTVSSVIAEYEVAAFGRVEDSRAEITVHDIRIVKEETGVNVLCLNEAHEFDITIGKANDTLPSSQNNMLLMKFGPIVNTGVSKRTTGESPADNRIVMEVLIRITDHPQNENDKQVMVDVGGMTGKLIVITQQPMTIKRHEADAANLFINLTHNDQDVPFKKNDEVVLSALLHHDNETSSREPAPGTVRFIWGPYMRYKDESIEVNATFQSLTNGTSHMDVEFEYILFDEWISINLTLETDPTEVREPGSGIIKAVTLVRPVCKYDQMDASDGGGKNPITTTQLYYYCGEIAHVSYEVDAPDCYDNLNFVNLPPECIIASTEADDSRAAAKAAAGDAWSPAYGPKQSEDYLIINFQQKTRITRVKVLDNAPDRKVTKFKIEYGQSEYGFQSPQTADVGADGLTTLATPIVGQFIRFTIVEAEDKPNEYVGVKLEFYGCPQGDGVLDTCSFQQTTRTPANWRNIAYEATSDHIYYCYYNDKKKSMNCYCSKDGITWREMPSYIGYLEGSKGGYMYVREQKKLAYLKSPDCEHWIVEDPYDNTGIDPATELPGKKDLSDVNIGGDWTATQQGLKKGGKMVTKWFGCCEG